MRRAITKTKTMFKSVFSPFIFLAIAAVVVLLYGLPFYENVQNQRAELQSYAEALDTADKVADIEADLRNRLESFSEEDLEKFSKMLPEASRTIKDVSDVNNIAEENGVTLSSVSIEESEQSESEQGQGEGVRSAGVTYSLAARYPDFLDFLRALEGRLRVTDVTSISFTVDEGTTREGTEGVTASDVYNIELGTQAYWINQE